MSATDLWTAAVAQRVRQQVGTWRQIALSTDPANRPQAAAGVRQAYRRAGLPPPRHTVWVGSPLALALLVASRYSRTQLRSRWYFGDLLQGVVDLTNKTAYAVEQVALWPYVLAHAPRGVRADIRRARQTRLAPPGWQPVFPKVWQRVVAAADTAVRDALPPQAYNLLHGDIGPQQNVLSRVFAAAVSGGLDHTLPPSWTGLVGNMLRRTVPRLHSGQHRALQTGFFHYCGQQLNVSGAQNMASIWAITNAAGWWWPCRDICVLSDRPKTLHLDEHGRLHDETGPALAYRDGWRVYGWHGVLVPRWVIVKPERITLAAINGERNVEVRRVLIERYGFGRYLQDSGAQLIHEDEYGRLYRQDQPGDEPLVLVGVTNTTAEADGTHKQYFLRVPPDIRTAHAAVAWTAGLPPEAYVIAAES